MTGKAQPKWTGCLGLRFRGGHQLLFACHTAPIAAIQLHCLLSHNSSDHRSAGDIQLGTASEHDFVFKHTFTQFLKVMVNQQIPGFFHKLLGNYCKGCESNKKSSESEFTMALRGLFSITPVSGRS